MRGRTSRAVGTCSLAGAVLFAGLQGCRPESASGRGAVDGAAILTSTEAPSSADASPQPLLPLAGLPWMIEVRDERDGGKGRSLGFVTVPLGARERRPVVIALHGGGDQPDWACGEWRIIAGTYPFVVCPTGPGNASFRSWSHAEDTRARIDALVASVKERFAPWLADGPPILVGFSRGAMQVADIAAAHPRSYPRVAISESAFAPQSVQQFSRPWAKGGGERVLLSCTTVGCEATYKAAACNLEKLGARSRVNIAGTNQHGIWDTVIASAQRDWPWLVEGHPGWEGFTMPDPDAARPGRTVLGCPR